MGTPKKLLFIVNVDWFLVSHRLPILKAAKKAGFDIHVVAKFTGCEMVLKDAGFTLHSINFERSGINPLREMKVLFSLARIIRKVRPDVVHMVTIKPVLYGSILTRFCWRKSKRVVAMSGLGYIFIAKGLAAALKQRIVSFMYRLGLKNRQVSVIFQNTADQDFFIQSKIVSPDQAYLIRGSGVRLTDFSYEKASNKVPVVALMGRLLKDKGVYEFVSAVKKLREGNLEFRAVLIGKIDENPESISETQLEEWVHDGLIENWGFTTKVAETLKGVDIMVLPSYREGLPKSLIEAAAAGKPVITTDVPGCRDAIKPDETGFLIPAKNVLKLAERMECLIQDSELRDEMGKNGRKWAEEAFDIEDVIAKHLELYVLG